ncbi:hypothetical protein L1887_51510 [Cichorium endivia]|nr:hypothetical protein L1887_51510 [Cichorium endivia]
MSSGWKDPRKAAAAQRFSVARLSTRSNTLRVSKRAPNARHSTETVLASPDCSDNADASWTTQTAASIGAVVSRAPSMPFRVAPNRFALEPGRRAASTRAAFLEPQLFLAAAAGAHSPAAECFVVDSLASFHSTLTIQRQLGRRCLGAAVAILALCASGARAWETKAQALEQAVSLVHDPNVFGVSSLSTRYPPDHAVTELADHVITGPEYYSLCDPEEGSLLYLGLTVSQTWRNVLHSESRNATVSIASNADPSLPDPRHSSKHHPDRWQDHRPSSKISSASRVTKRPAFLRAFRSRVETNTSRTLFGEAWRSCKLRVQATAAAAAGASEEVRGSP